MVIVTKILLDRTGAPYWSSMVLTDEKISGNCALQVNAPTTFPILLNKQYRETFENVAMRTLAELNKEPDQFTLRKMLTQGELNIANNPKDKV